MSDLTSSPTSPTTEGNNAVTTAERIEPQQTVQEYVKQIPQYAWLRNTGSDRRYIWVSWAQTGSDNVIEATMVSAQTGRILTVNLNLDDAQKYVLTDTPVNAELITPFIAAVSSYSYQLSDKEKLVDRMRADWNVLSSRIQQECEARDWCGEYDAIVDDVNFQLEVFQMPTRKRDYDVEATVTVTYNVSFKVEDQENEDCARYEVENLSVSEILDAAGGSWPYYDDCCIEIDSLDPA